ncbi:hypothetical protein Bacsa_3616 [Phocaeicola salanitronis DSM 18170]|uniref:Lipoprotein n=1 Tax=Phocaeicola salanitronis (strain DSM 18170 / JCM 13657 / CCUG 60908 / BL78) TaxID=667015 RepID=F0R917_PHOSB|nr:hypothetical protein [Phocaeicola salanitronis]ADY38138.1 hypothetical protein Bacsa_3616 [Phocaeicola salanitronis DSM 18170]
MRMNRLYIGTGMLGMLFFAACSQNDVPDNGASGSAEMRIYTDVARADGEETDAGSTANDAVFLFWDFGDVLGNAVDPTPLYVKQPEKHIDTYKRPNEPYNTGELYPDGNRRVMATGYAPATLTPEMRTDNTDNYERLTIPKDGLCKTDVLTSITPIVASAALPFDREYGETLQFMHAQSRVYFYAKLAKGSKEFLKNVRIKLSHTVVATHVEWNRYKSLYVPIASGQESYELAQQPNDDNDYYMLTPENPLEIGWAYIVPGQTDLSVEVTVARGESAEATEWKDFTVEPTFEFKIERDAGDDWDKGKNENTLYANESYTFTLVFSEEGIELIGNECPWEEGGYLVIPIYPFN